jgi:hypothetical protein
VADPIESTVLIHGNEGTGTFTPDTGGEIELDFREATINPRRDLADASGSRSNGWRRRVPGMKDVTGSVQVYFTRNETSPMLGLEPGVRGTFAFNHTATGITYSGPARLGEEFTDTIYSNDDAKVIEIPFQGDGEWNYG